MDPFNASAYFRWASVNTTLQLLQILVTSPSGLLGGLVGEELLLWLNVNFVAPTTDDGRRYASKEKPWLEKGYWNYLVRCGCSHSKTSGSDLLTNISHTGLPYAACPKGRCISLQISQNIPRHPSATSRLACPRYYKSIQEHRTSLPNMNSSPVCADGKIQSAYYGTRCRCWMNLKDVEIGGKD